MQLYLTTLILGGLRELSDPHILLKAGPRGSSLFVTLSAGISAHLDTTDRLGRKQAMEVAQTISTMLGHPINFDASSHEQTDLSNQQISFSSSALDDQPISQEHGSDLDSESDIGSEIEAYEIVDTRARASVVASKGGPEIDLSTVYLRECLTSKRYDTYNHHYLFFQSAPNSRRQRRGL